MCVCVWGGGGGGGGGGVNVYVTCKRIGKVQHAQYRIGTSTTA